MTTETHLRLTHIAQVTGASGYYVRFSAIGQSVQAQIAWDFVKAFLKKEGVGRAKWTPDFNFRDGKKGAWWLSEETLLLYADCFSNFARALATRDTYSDTRPPHNILYAVGESKLANVGCPNGLKFPQILVNALEVKYA